MNEEENKTPEQQNGAPEPSKQQPQPVLPQPSPQEMKMLKNAQTMVIAGNIAGPVSLMFGGVLLSSIALIIEIIACTKLSKLAKGKTPFAQAASRLRRANIVGLVICAAAVALNIYAAVIMYPIVLEAVQSGDLSNLLKGDFSASSTNAPNSTWG
ncbi:MAG: hypothetical protein RR362_05535 [Raoultibacter sp.]